MLVQLITEFDIFVGVHLAGVHFWIIVLVSKVNSA